MPRFWGAGSENLLHTTKREVGGLNTLLPSTQAGGASWPHCSVVLWVTVEALWPAALQQSFNKLLISSALVFYLWTP